MLLSEFVANHETISNISDAMSRGTLPHAIILEGEAGTGKRTLADIIAQYCVCTAPGSGPCGQCSGCAKAMKRIHPDIVYADGTRSGELSVGAIRQIRSDAYIKPNEAPSKVFVLQNCDKMLPPAQNAFLKVLEEPPANVHFILTVTSANMLLETVRSRSRIYSLFPPEAEEAAAYVETRLPEHSPQEILHYAKLCNGNIGQTLMMSEGNNEEAHQLANNILMALVPNTDYELLKYTSMLTRDRAFAAAVLDELLELAADCLKRSEGLEIHSETVDALTKKMSRKKIYQLCQHICYAGQILKTNVNLNFYGTWLCAELRK